MVNFVSGSNGLDWDQQQQQQQMQMQAWGLPEQLRFVFMFMLWMAATVARALLVLLPPQIHSAGLTNMLESFRTNNPFLTEDDAPAAAWIGPGAASTKALMGGSSTKHAVASASSSSKGSAMGRALSQALELVNDTPASSRKYVFVRALADKLIHENAAHGSQALKEVNQIAVQEGFARTIYQLSQYLEGIKQQQQVDALAWPWRVLKGIPLGVTTSQLSAVPFVGNIGHYLGYACRSSAQIQQQAAASRVAQIAEKEEMTEKLAQELSWMAEKLNECSALDDAIRQWSTTTSLASLSLCANPRVQRSLMKLSVILCRGMVSGDYEVSIDITSQLLLLWLPLLCSNISGIEGSVFSAYEKAEAERMLEQAIFILPESEQEMVLAVWLREFTHSSSDWPNLQSCYYNWCHVSRKLDYIVCEDISDKQS
ncbi:hypothetical protein O6H91_17G002400 [Diphasiastrum complanatum]|uniref:Uncharacterized protein n=1 Tax=Diphasiastrum complanatum TaxID=34168 RepID=A0ACC2B4U2_DIPCM|nr:hypothetical protein O6H91_17G002400 [Diphasiastrum complanatum]